MSGRSPSGALSLAGVLGFLYLPMAVLVLYSFNDSRIALSWEGFTLDWYRAVFRSPEIARAVRNTLVVSGVSTVVSTLLGTGLAVGLHFGRFRGRGAARGAVYLPVLVPDIILAVAMLAFFALVGMPLGLATITVAHVAFQISFVALLVRARLEDFPRSLVEASLDLGAGPLRTLRSVVIPLAAPGIVGGALVAFTLSVDDFLIAYFTAGPGSSTLPIRIYSMIKRGVSPEVNAVATLLLVLSLVTIPIALVLVERGRSGRRKGGEQA